MASLLGQALPGVYVETGPDEDRPIGSPLGNLIEELRLRQAEVSGEGVALPSCLQSQLNLEDDEDEEDEDIGDANLPVVGRHGSHDCTLHEFAFTATLMGGPSPRAIPPRSILPLRVPRSILPLRVRPFRQPFLSFGLQTPTKLFLVFP